MDPLVGELILLMITTLMEITKIIVEIVETETKASEQSSDEAYKPCPDVQDSSVAVTNSGNIRFKDSATQSELNDSSMSIENDLQTSQIIENSENICVLRDIQTSSIQDSSRIERSNMGSGVNPTSALPSEKISKSKAALPSGKISQSKAALPSGKISQSKAAIPSEANRTFKDVCISEKYVIPPVEDPSMYKCVDELIVIFKNERSSLSVWGKVKKRLQEETAIEALSIYNSKFGAPDILPVRKDVRDRLGLSELKTGSLTKDLHRKYYASRSKEKYSRPRKELIDETSSLISKAMLMESQKRPVLSSWKSLICSNLPTFRSSRDVIDLYLNKYDLSYLTENSRLLKVKRREFYEDLIEKARTLKTKPGDFKLKLSRDESKKDVGEYMGKKFKTPATKITRSDLKPLQNPDGSVESKVPDEESLRKYLESNFAQ